MAFEEDALIFNALLQPLLVHNENPMSKKQRVDEGSSSSDPDDVSDSEVPDIEATNLFCK